MGPLTGITCHRAAEHRADAVRGHAARRPRRRGAAPRPRDVASRPGERHDARVAVLGASTAAGASIGHRPEAPATAPRSCSRLCERADVLHRGLPARRRRAARRRARRVLGPQPAPRLRPHDRLGPGRPARAATSATTSTTSRSRACSRTSAPAGGPPVPPINLLGDFGGGGLLLVVRRPRRAASSASSPGEGQVVDAAMVDGARMLMSVFFGLDAMGFWSDDARHEPARRRRALLRRVRDRRRRVRSRSRATSRSSTPSSLRAARAARHRRSTRRRRWTRRSGPALKAAMADAVPDPHPRRVGRVLRRPRGLLRARCSR